jgi:hypothetical protein
MFISSLYHRKENRSIPKSLASQEFRGSITKALVEDEKTEGWARLLRIPRMSFWLFLALFFHTGKACAF